MVTTPNYCVNDSKPATRWITLYQGKKTKERPMGTSAKGYYICDDCFDHFAKFKQLRLQDWESPKEKKALVCKYNGVPDRGCEDCIEGKCNKDVYQAGCCYLCYKCNCGECDE